MNAEAQRILAEAMTLSASERADLAAELLCSLDALRDEDAESAWAREVESRVRALELGTVNTMPWSEARRLILGGENGDSPR